jgi:hypothetical protein
MMYAPSAALRANATTGLDSTSDSTIAIGKLPP